MSKARAKLSTLILLAMAGCAADRELPVSMDELPTPVRATLERERMGGEVLDSEKETTDGRTVYSFDVNINGRAYDLNIAEDGSLLGKTLDGGAPTDVRSGIRATDYKRDVRNTGTGYVPR